MTKKSLQLAAVAAGMVLTAVVPAAVQAAQATVSLTIRLHIDRPVRVRSTTRSGQIEADSISRSVQRCSESVRAELRTVLSPREADETAHRLREGSVVVAGSGVFVVGTGTQVWLAPARGEDRPAFSL